jgi:hypothetical protein
MNFNYLIRSLNSFVQHTALLSTNTYPTFMICCLTSHPTNHPPRVLLPEDLYMISGNGDHVIAKSSADLFSYRLLI